MTSGSRWFLLIVIGALVACAAEQRLSTRSEEALAAYEAGLEEMRRFRMPEAVAHFEAAVQADSTFAMAHLELARCASWVGRQAELKSEYATAYRLREGATEQERLQIEHSYAAHLRNREEADRLHAELSSRYPNDSYTLQVSALKHWRAGEFDQAARSYQQIIDQDASRVEVHNLLGYLFLEAGRYEEAIQSFQRYVFYAPDLANPHDSLGDAFMATGQYDDALTQYRAALDIDPTFLHSWAQLSAVLILTGQLEQARSTLDKTTELFDQLSQTGTRAMLELLILYTAEEWERLSTEALARLALPEMDDPSERSHGLNVAALRVIALLELGHLDEARSARAEFDRRLASLVDDYAASDPQNMPDFARLAASSLDSRFARAEGNPEAGIPALAEALSASEQSPHELSDFRLELAQARLAAGDPNAALAEVDVLLRVIPTHPQANLRAAEILAELGRTQELLRHVGIYLEVMRRADASLPELRRARRLAERYAVAN